MSKSAAGLAHIVYFTLQDSSPSKIDELLAACKKYLDDHPGVVYFSVGRLNPDLARPVNDRDFHVALHVIFADRASHDAYQVAERHNQFIAEQKPNWKTVRVFDADLV
jgi:Stress responsive A/B Barrel Domain